HLELALDALEAEAVARRAGFDDHLAAAAAARAHARQREQPLLHAQLAAPVARRARAQAAAPGGAAAAAARRALAPRREADGLLGTERRLLELELERVAQVAAGGLLLLLEQVEEALEQVGHRRRRAAVRGPRRAERGVPQAVVGRALVGVRQDRVGLVGLL